VAVVILGMHRSGTSVLTRTISLLGADLPRNLYGAGVGNETGHWEPARILELNDWLLAAIGSSTADPLELPAGWSDSPAAREFLPRMIELLADEYGESELFVLKDPRLCRLLALWLEAFSAAGVEPRFVLAVRNPLEAARSLHARSPVVPLADGLRMWLSHCSATERDTRGHPRSVVLYDELLRDWRSVVGRIAAELDLTWPLLGDHRAEAEISRFMRPGRPRETVSIDELQAAEEVSEEVVAQFLSLRRQAVSEPKESAR